MSRNKLIAILTAVSVSACLYACGSDDDTNPATGGAAGHATGGKGSGGSGKGGSGNTAGKNSGGSGNEAGEIAGGEGGTDAGGAGGDKGMAGDSGLGGAGDAAGAGGAPPAALTLAEACAATCIPAHSVDTCSTTQDVCVTSCTSYPAYVTTAGADADTATLLNAEYLTMISCLAQHVPNTTQYVCSAPPAINLWSSKKETDCETAVCKWTCDDGNSVVSAADADVYARCGC